MTHQMLMTAPFWLVVGFGAILCLRNSRRRKRESTFCAIALLLMMGGMGYGMFLHERLFELLGAQLASNWGMLAHFVFTNGSLALAYAILLWAALQKP